MTGQIALKGTLSIRVHLPFLWVVAAARKSENARDRLKELGLNVVACGQLVRVIASVQLCAAPS